MAPRSAAHRNGLGGVAAAVAALLLVVTHGSSDELDKMKKTDDPHKLVHPEEHHLVKECLQLFHRTVDEKCGKKFKVQVLSASMGVISGIELRMYLSITGREHAHHRVLCAFQTVRPTKKSLKGIKEDEVLPEEKHGLSGTIEMFRDLCDADIKSSVPKEVKHTLRLVEQHGLGELSRYEGYRDVYRHVPLWVRSLQLKAEEEPLPESYSLKDKFPHCFPGRAGSEVVRYQGVCGSCWAFASASALMTNLCVPHNSSNHTLKHKDDRLEIAVQRILTCNPQGFGCNGGHALAAADSFRKYGLAIDSLLEYKCKGGNALDHFNKASEQCEDYPWGGNRSETCGDHHRYKAWKYVGIERARDEHAMMTAIVQGYSMYSTMDVYENFMYFQGGTVYDSVVGSKLGGHAVVTLGYGKHNDVKYWLIQNSWGTGWASHGYAMFLRGKNLCGFEEWSMIFTGKVFEGTTPPHNWSKPTSSNDDDDESGGGLNIPGLDIVWAWIMRLLGKGPKEDSPKI